MGGVLQSMLSFSAEHAFILDELAVKDPLLLSYLVIELFIWRASQRLRHLLPGVKAWRPNRGCRGWHILAIGRLADITYVRL